MNENTDLEMIIKEIEKYAVSHPDTGLPDSFKRNVPDIFVKVYDPILAKNNWYRLADAFYRIFSAGLNADVASAVRVLIDMYEEQLRTMYKGKDGKDYSSASELESANSEYQEYMNPKIGKAR